MLKDLVDRANDQIDGWHWMPIAYGSAQAADRLGVPAAQIRRALRNLDANGVIECVGRLTYMGLLKGQGAKLYRLVGQESDA